MKNLILSMLLFISIYSFPQGNPPWERPLKIAWSDNGITFTNTSIFQDSSGVPSLVKWKGDTLACVFQWFRQPINSSTWDKVAVKFSYDAGQSWTNPTPIIVNGLPANYQRPFDPTLAVISSDSLRVYFSSSDGMPLGGLDSIVNTYSAISTDGINYNYEPNPRFDHPTKPVIDPAAIYFNGSWHYEAPAGAPQDGAFHCISNNGINFIQQTDFLSDNSHNWTGNFMLENSGELRFYGSGQSVWYNSSSDGYFWQGYINTNIVGGDPSVEKLGDANYLAVFVGTPYTVEVTENTIIERQIQIFPNPFTREISLLPNTFNDCFCILTNPIGQIIWSGVQIEHQDFSSLVAGLYFLRVNAKNSIQTIKIIKK